MQQLSLWRLLAITLWSCTIAVHQQALADDFDDLFSDDAFSDVDASTEITEPSPWSISHELGSRVIINVNSDEANAIEQRFSGVSSVMAYYQPEFDLSINDSLSVSGDIRFSSDAIFWLRSDEDWSDEDISSRQTKIDINELVALARLGNWQFSSGIQTVTLGLADALSISNTLYAQNMSLPGVTEQDESIVPAWTSMASGSIGRVRIKAGAIHQHKMNGLAEPGTDFATPLSSIDIAEKELALENMSAFISVSGVAGALDWQLNANSQLEHTPYVEMQLVNPGPPPQLAPSTIDFARTESASVAASYVIGSTLLKAEAGVTQGLMAQSLNGTMPGAMTDYSRLNTVVGFDYDNSTIARMMAEVQYNRILDYSSLNLMNTEEQSVQWMLLISRKFMRDNLTVFGQVIGFDASGNAGRFQGLGIEFDISDQLSSTLRYVDYVAGDFILLQGADDRDRVAMSVSYRF